MKHFVLIAFFLLASMAGAYEQKTEDVRQIQELLKELGYDLGFPDGIIGAKTERAIRTFQQDSALLVTGKIDEETRKQLFVKAQKSREPAPIPCESLPLLNDNPISQTATTTLPPYIVFAKADERYPSGEMKEKWHIQNNDSRSVNYVSVPLTRRTANLDEARTAICVHSWVSDSGTYSGIGVGLISGYRLHWDIDVLQLPEKKLIVHKTFDGGRPAAQQNVSRLSKAVYGDEPRQSDVFSWLTQIVRRESPLLVQGESLKQVAFSAAGVLASAGVHTVRLWNIGNPAEKPFRTINTPYPGDVQSVAFSPDGKLLAIGEHYGANGSVVKIWSVDEGELIRTIKANSYVETLAFSPTSSSNRSGSASLQRTAQASRMTVIANTLSYHLKSGQWLSPQNRPTDNDGRDRCFYSVAFESSKRFSIVCSNRP